MESVFKKLSDYIPSKIKIKTPVLGIPNYVSHYLKLSPKQDPSKELEGLDHLIIDFIKSDDRFGNNVQFINFGGRQLVFTINDKYTLMVNQPATNATKLGFGKNEYSNLLRLNQIASNLVIKPIMYFEEDKRELYVTPYYKNARCICVEKNNWGMWIPEIGLVFKKFNELEKSMVNSSMVAAMVQLYDEDRQQGLAKYRIDGGDFMLNPEIESAEMNYENIYKNLKLIAAREFIKLGLDKYIDQLRIELLGKVKKDDLLILGKELKHPMTLQEINTGVAIGMTKREQMKNDLQETNERSK